MVNINSTEPVKIGKKLYPFWLSRYFRKANIFMFKTKARIRFSDILWLPPLWQGSLDNKGIQGNFTRWDFCPKCSPLFLTALIAK